MAEKVPLAGIAVISKSNLQYPQVIADYYISRGIAFRVLDIYQATDTLPLTRKAAASLAQYQTFFKELYCLPEVQAALRRGLSIEPLATARSMLEEWQRGYCSPLSDDAPSHREWALAVNTNGDVYSPGDCYDENLKSGNLSLDAWTRVFHLGGTTETVDAPRSGASQFATECSSYGRAAKASTFLTRPLGARRIIAVIKGVTTACWQAGCGMCRRPVRLKGRYTFNALHPPRMDGAGKSSI